MIQFQNLAPGEDSLAGGRIYLAGKVFPAFHDCLLFLSLRKRERREGSQIFLNLSNLEQIS